MKAKKAVMTVLTVLCAAGAVAGYVLAREEGSARAEVWASALLILAFVCWQWQRALKNEKR
ncbi:MAG TPA: hypothetical protein IAB67_01100 [Candidatus Ventrousia excrementavium]|uniref:Uncharacterized protein n=1 Tax=Candidatus Ventrousia excrementavium TaxID=2840961 RepID=A0A9D1LK94_9CLOT|nr:hypothetical protein [Candidatus Ventrousia excrementavium]